MNIEEYRKLMLAKESKGKKNKYNAKRTEVDGIKFHSKKESEYYQKLVLAKKAGELLHFEMQVPFEICQGRKYLLDFMERWKDGSMRYIDTKGFDTPVSKLKRAVVEEKYGIKIEVI